MTGRVSPAFPRQGGAAGVIVGARTALAAAALLCAALLAPGAVEALPWNKDMKDQPSVKAQEEVVALPAASVPSDGGEMDGPEGLQELVRDRIRAGEALGDLLVADEADGARGALMYEYYCQACHGPGGAGNGNVGIKYTPQPMDLTLPYVQNQPDGQLYYTITHGGVVMPGYRFALSQEDRWRVVRYLRGGLLEQAARLEEAAESEAEAAEGETGAQAAE